MKSTKFKSRVKVSLILLCTVLIILSLFALNLTAVQNENTDPIYMLKDCGGKICLYSANGENKLTEYGIYTRLLPSIDSESLVLGIPIYSERELQRLIEDFDS